MQNHNHQKIIIAIDGFSSCGKSTLAKALADRLAYIYIDTGAMYRAATLYILDEGVDVNSELEVENALENIHIQFQRDQNSLKTLLNNKNVDDEIRSMRVSNAVSEVSALPIIREHIVAIQKQMGKDKGIVMEGRDIGTVVFPNAELKIFLTADPAIRIERRFQELLNKGKNPIREEVAKNLEMRDLIDSTRSHSPLRKAEDAIEINNSELTVEDQIEIILEYIRQIVSG